MGREQSTFSSIRTPFPSHQEPGTKSDLVRRLRKSSGRAGLRQRLLHLADLTGLIAQMGPERLMLPWVPNNHRYVQPRGNPIFGHLLNSGTDVAFTGTATQIGSAVAPRRTSESFSSHPYLQSLAASCISILLLGGYYRAFRIHSCYSRWCQRSPTSSEESPCDDKTRPKQNQARGLRRYIRQEVYMIWCY